MTYRDVTFKKGAVDVGDDQSRLKAKSALPPPTARKRGGNEPEGGCAFFRRLRIPGKGMCSRVAKRVDVADDCGSCGHKETTKTKARRSKETGKSIVALLERTSDSRYARDGENWIDLILRLRRTDNRAALGAVLTILQRQGVGSIDEIIEFVDSSDSKPITDVPLKPRKKVRPRVVGEGRADQFEARLSSPNPLDPWESRASSLLRSVPSGNHQTVRQYLATRLQKLGATSRIGFLQRYLDSSNLLPDNIEEAKMELLSELPEDFEWGNEQSDDDLGSFITDTGVRGIPLTDDIKHASRRDIYGQRALNVLRGVPDDFNGTVREYLVKVVAESDGPVDAGMRLQEIMKANSVLPYDLQEVQQAITPALPEGWSWNIEEDRRQYTNHEEESRMPEGVKLWQKTHHKRVCLDKQARAEFLWDDLPGNLRELLSEPSEGESISEWLVRLRNEVDGDWMPQMAEFLGYANSDSLSAVISQCKRELGDSNTQSSDPEPDSDPDPEPNPENETEEDPEPSLTEPLPNDPEPTSLGNDPTDPEPKPDDDPIQQDPTVPPPPADPDPTGPNPSDDPGQVGCPDHNVVDLGGSESARDLVALFNALNPEQKAMVCERMLAAVVPWPIPPEVKLHVELERITAGLE